MAKKAKARSAKKTKSARAKKKAKSAKKVKTARKTSKAKKTKPKAKSKARRARPARRRPTADPCAQLRAVHERLTARIAELQELLSGTDIPDLERRRLQSELARRQNQLAVNTPLLEDCERLHPPRRG
jgi:hypothetical protein